MPTRSRRRWRTGCCSSGCRRPRRRSRDGSPSRQSDIVRNWEYEIPEEANMSTEVVNRKSPGTVEKQRPARRVTFSPRVDVLELPEELVLLVDLPGVKPDGVTL